MPERAEPKKDMGRAALRRFATAITVLNILGHTVLGFEQSLATPVTAVLVAYATEILLELVESWRLGRRPRFLGGGVVRVVDFLLSAHITGLAVAMLLYANDRLLPVAFAAATAIGSEYPFLPGANGPGPHVVSPSD